MTARRRTKRSAREIEKEKKRRAAARAKRPAKKSATRKPAPKKRVTKKASAKKKPAAGKKAPAKRKSSPRVSRAEEKRLEARRARDRARKLREKEERRAREAYEAERALGRRRAARKTPEEKKRAKAKRKKVPPKKTAAEEPKEKQLGRLKRKVGKLEREIEKESRRELASKPRVRDKSRQVANGYRVHLSNTRDELLKSGVSSHYRVAVGSLHEVDGELSVSYPDWVATVDDATQVLSLVEEAFDNIRDVQWLTVGFSLEQKANDEGIRKNVNSYLPYQGAYRIVPDYTAAEEQAMSFQAAYEILRNVYNAHGMLPTGMIVRISWSPDGKLWTRNDSDRRKKR